jgi:hypothetical protein
LFLLFVSNFIFFLSIDPALWGSVADWDHFINEMPGSTYVEAHKTLANELKILLNHFAENSRGWYKAKAIKKQLKVCFILCYVEIA